MSKKPMLCARRVMLGLMGVLKSRANRSIPKSDLDFFLGFFLGSGWLGLSESSGVGSSPQSLSTPDEADGTDQLEDREWLESVESLEEEDAEEMR